MPRLICRGDFNAGIPGSDMQALDTKESNSEAEKFGELRPIFFLVVLVLGFCLFFERLSTLGFFASISNEVMILCHDPNTQWMVFFCAAAYFVIFVLLLVRLSRRDSSTRPPKTERAPWLVFNQSSVWL